MKRFFLSLIFLTSSLTSVIATSSTFDPEKNTLTINSVTVTGDQIYSNVVIRLDQFTVLGVGSSAPIGYVSETCRSENFTIDRFNAIQPGMTIEQVTQIISCRSDISFSGVTLLSYDWDYVNELREAFSISVVFEPSSLTVHEQLGSFKKAIGF